MEQALRQNNSEKDITSSLAGFYQLKYGTTSPNLKRLDSTIRHATVSTSPEAQLKIKKLSSSMDSISQTSMALPKSLSRRSLPPTSPIHTEISEEEKAENSAGTTEQEEFYEEMTSGLDRLKDDDDKDDEDDGYTYMFHGKKLNKETSEMVKKVAIQAKTSLSPSKSVPIVRESEPDNYVYEEWSNEPRYTLSANNGKFDL